MTQKISNPQKALVLIDLYLMSQYEVPTPNGGRVMSEQSNYLNKNNKKKKRCFAWGVRKLVVVFCMESGAFLFLFQKHSLCGSGYIGILQKYISTTSLQ